MASTNLPPFQKFNVDDNIASLAANWKKWVKKLENLFVALKVQDEPQKKALLLYYAGDRVGDIYETLNDTSETFVAAKEILNTYFEPKKNLTYEVYSFRKLYQHEDEPINAFVSRLRESANRCDFNDVNREIKDQVVLNCKSDKLRRKALSEDLALDRLLDMARAHELAEKQANEIEKSKVNKVNSFTRVNKGNRGERLDETAKPSTKSCFKCGKSWPHKDKCPAIGKESSICKKLNHFLSYGAQTIAQGSS